MDWKEFFKPNILKIIIFVSLVVISHLISINTVELVSGGHSNPIGLPLAFYQEGGSYFDGHDYTYWDTKINYGFLLINLITWYLVSCIILIKKSLRN